MTEDCFTILMRLFSLSHQDHHFHKVNQNLAETTVSKYSVMMNCVVISFNVKIDGLAGHADSPLALKADGSVGHGVGWPSGDCTISYAHAFAFLHGFVNVAFYGILWNAECYVFSVN